MAADGRPLAQRGFFPPLLVGLVALAIGLLTLTPVGRAWASDFLSQFRVQQFAVVTFDPRETSGPTIDLAQLGTVETEETSYFAPPASIDDASQLVGFRLRQPEPLPSGLGQPTIDLRPASTFRFTFDQDRAREYLASIGEEDFSLPPEFHGATISVNIPTAVILTYPGSEGGPRLLLVQLRPPTVDVSGSVGLAELREFLLSIPGLPPETAAQLRSIDDWTTTLPVPAPKGEVHWRETQINGASGLIAADNTGLGSGALWVEGDVLRALAGPLTENELLQIAASLK